MSGQRRSVRKKGELSAAELREREQKRLRAARRLRVLGLGTLLLGGTFCVLHRAYEIQVESPETYERRYRQEIELQARRGNIYDRNGAALAVSVDLDSFFVDPVALRNNELSPEKVVRSLAEVLKVDPEPLIERMADGKRRFVWIKRRVTPAESQAVAKLGLLGRGVGVRKEPRRYYPNRGTGAHVLGFTDDQGNGVEGLERTFDTRLRGATDKVAAIFDARGGVIFSEEPVDGESAQGRNLRLTIDREIQVIAERELELRVRQVEARAGHVVVMDPQTGSVLALASYPTFNPNAPGSADPAARRNRAVSDRFEPGSGIKTFTLGGAVEAGVIVPSQLIDCENGSMWVGGSEINDTHAYGKLTPKEILAHSSNIGTAKIGAALGRGGLYQVLRRFGFGTRSGIDLPMETGGVLRHYKHWYEIDAANIAFGQGMSVNNVQLAAAMAAVANGGELMKPRIVESVMNVQGKVVESFPPVVRRRVLSPDNARTMTDMLTAATGAGGTGEAAALEGYPVAGKTGTAQKAGPRGGYAQGQYTSSFVGFVPAPRPRLVISVVIDEPVIEYYGGTVAGPVFRRIATEALRHLGVPPEAGGDKLAEVVKQRRSQRTESPKSAVPTAQAEASGAQLAGDKVRVPDLRGYGARAALVALERAGLHVTLAGSGAATEQSPSAGAVVPRGATVHVVLRRPGTPAPGSGERKARDVVAGSEPLASAAGRDSR